MSSVNYYDVEKMISDAGDELRAAIRDAIRDLHAEIVELRGELDEVRYRLERLMVEQ